MDTYTEPVIAKRRHRGLEEKRRIVEETLVEGASVALVARTHGVNANLVFNWRRLYQAGRLGGCDRAKLLPVKVTAESSPRRTGAWREPGSSVRMLGGHDSHPTAACEGAHRGQCGPGFVARVVGVLAGMIGAPTNTRVWIAAGVTDLRRGFTGLSALVQTKLEQSPFRVKYLCSADDVVI